MISSFPTSVLDGGRDTIKAFVGLLDHVRRKMERDDDMTLKSQEGVQREDNIEELMEAVHSCVQHLLQTAHSSSKSRTL